MRYFVGILAFLTFITGLFIQEINNSLFSTIIGGIAGFTITQLTLWANK